MYIIPKAIYKLYAIPAKMVMILFTEIENKILKLIWNQKRSQIAKAILSKNNNNVGATIPIFKIYYRARHISYSTDMEIDM